MVEAEGGGSGSAEKPEFVDRIPLCAGGDGAHSQGAFVVAQVDGDQRAGFVLDRLLGDDEFDRREAQGGRGVDAVAHAHERGAELSAPSATAPGGRAQGAHDAGRGGHRCGDGQGRRSRREVVGRAGRVGHGGGQGWGWWVWMRGRLRQAESCMKIQYWC